jgi:5'-nucleotidase
MRLAAALLVICVALGCRKTRKTPPPPHSSGSECVSIIGWNDLHGQLDSESAFVDTGRVPSGGVIALADHIDALRHGGDPVVVVDAGDLFTGPMESTLSEGAPVIAAYNIIGIDAAAVGNHEFDFGPVGYDRVVAPPGTTDGAAADGPRGALLARMLEAKFPFVSANLRTASGTVPPWPNLHDHVVVERGGFRVGIVGYTTIETPDTTLRPNVADLEFIKGAAERVQASIRALRASGAAPIILLAHASLDGELPQSLDELNDPVGLNHKGELARLLAAVGSDLPDLVVAGHRHAWMLGRVRGVPIVSSDQHGVGYARARFCRKDKTITLAALERRLTFASSAPVSEIGKRVAAVVAPYVDAVRVRADEVVTTVPRLCVPQGPNGTALAEQIARSMLTRATLEGLIDKNISAVAVINAGGVRTPLGAGPIRYRELFALLPFENALATCTTTRAGLVRGLENLAARMTVRDRFPFGIAGAKVRARRTTKSPLEIADVAIDGGKPGDRVTIIMPDFLLYGGDGFLKGVTCEASSIAATRIRDAYRTLLANEPGGCDGAPKNVQVEAP